MVGTPDIRGSAFLVASTVALGGVMLVASCGDDDCAALSNCGDSGAGAEGGGTTAASGSGGQGDPCGNGDLDQGEECDDGNTVDGDTCRADCSEPRCGDGIVDAGEICFTEAAVSIDLEIDSAKDVALGDCDGDGDLDVYVAAGLIDGNPPSVTILRGAGELVATPLRRNLVPKGNSVTVKLALGQFDDDPSPDLAVSTQSDGALHIGLWSGAADCAFGDEIVPSETFDADALTTLRLDEDDLDDVVMTTSTSDPPALLQFWLSTTQIWDSAAMAHNNSFGIAGGDIDGRGADDVVYTSFDDTELLWQRGTGSGFAAWDTVAGVGAGQRAIMLGDLDGDGDLDAASAFELAHAVTILDNVEGSFVIKVAAIPVASSAPGSPLAENPYDLALGDVDADGDLDIVTANRAVANGATPYSSVSVLLNDGSGAFVQANLEDHPLVAFDAPYAVGRAPIAVALGDLNRDGALDIITVSDYVDPNTDTSFASVLVSDP
jgi:cysteine-rich repeat protein